jgi:hypothetical protein
MVFFVSFSRVYRTDDFRQPYGRDPQRRKAIGMAIASVPAFPSALTRRSKAR